MEDESGAAEISPAEEGISIPEMHILKLVEEDGKSIKFSPHDTKRFDVEPLDFSQLVAAVVTPNPMLSHHPQLTSPQRLDGT